MRIQIWREFIAVIFVLSTIVAVTDCCSSRILLLREHTFKIVQHNFHNHLHEHAHELQQQIEQHVANLVTQMEFNKTLTPEVLLNEISSTPPTETVETEMPELTTSMPNENGTLSASNNSSLVTSSSSSSTAANSSSFAPPVAVKPVTKLNIPDNYLNMRNVVSIPCSGQYSTNFCLNGGHCFRYPLANHSFFYCECADGYIGERCESKSLNELYIPASALETTKPKVLMARIVFSFPMLMLLSTIYIIFGAFIVYRGPHAPTKHQRTTGFFAS